MYLANPVLADQYRRLTGKRTIDNYALKTLISMLQADGMEVVPNPAYIGGEQSWLRKTMLSLQTS